MVGESLGRIEQESERRHATFDPLKSRRRESIRLGMRRVGGVAVEKVGEEVENDPNSADDGNGRIMEPEGGDMMRRGDDIQWSDPMFLLVPGIQDER